MDKKKKKSADLPRRAESLPDKLSRDLAKLRVEEKKGKKIHQIQMHMLMQRWLYLIYHPVQNKLFCAPVTKRFYWKINFLPDRILTFGFNLAFVPPSPRKESWIRHCASVN